jgi:hypothetical protein
MNTTQERMETAIAPVVLTWTTREERDAATVSIVAPARRGPRFVLEVIAATALVIALTASTAAGFEAAHARARLVSQDDTAPTTRTATLLAVREATVQSAVTAPEKLDVEIVSEETAVPSVPHAHAQAASRPAPHPRYPWMQQH